jgi:hypothetical protein
MNSGALGFLYYLLLLIRCAYTPREVPRAKCMIRLIKNTARKM